MQSESIRHGPDTVAGVRNTPAEVRVGAVGESLVEPADSVIHLTAKGEIDGAGGFFQIAVRQSSFYHKPVGHAVSRVPRRRDGYAGGDVLVLAQGFDE